MAHFSMRNGIKFFDSVLTFETRTRNILSCWTVPILTKRASSDFKGEESLKEQGSIISHAEDKDLDNNSCHQKGKVNEDEKACVNHSDVIGTETTVLENIVPPKQTFYSVNPNSQSSHTKKGKQNQFEYTMKSVLSETQSSDKTLYFKNVWKSRGESLSEEKKEQPQNLSGYKSQRPEEITATALKNSDVFGTISMEDTHISDKPYHSDLRGANDRIEESLPDDIEERISGRRKIPLTKYGRIGKKAVWYNGQMLSLEKQGKIDEALAIFEHDMMVRDRVKPDKRTFSILIAMLGKTGHTIKCFQLIRQMKRLGLDPVDQIYTSLFNACGNSPDKREGLRRAQNLLNFFEENNVKPNLTTIKAAMKTFALCGEFPRAFSLMDEASQRLRIDNECFNHLMMACISDKTAGFRRAIQVWLKMKEYGLIPDTTIFNLLIRCTRDCKAGELSDFLEALGLSEQGGSDITLSSANDILKVHGGRYKKYGKSYNKDLKVIWEHKNLPVGRTNYSSIKHAPNPGNKGADITQGMLTIEGQISEVLATQQDNEFHPPAHSNNQHLQICKDILPNSKDTELVTSDKVIFSKGILSRSMYKEVLSEPIDEEKLQKALALPPTRSFSDLAKPEARLEILGGMTEVLTQMDEVGARQDVRTFTQLLACAPNTEAAEVALLMEMETRKVHPDTDFFNDIIMRRFRRRQFDSLQTILPLMSKRKMIPNMRTYAALALHCKKKEQMLELIDDMKVANVEPNVEIMGHFMSTSAYNFIYKSKVLEVMDELGLKPNEALIVHAEKAIAEAKRRIIEAEKSDPYSFYLTKTFQQPFQRFLSGYRQWLKHTEIEHREHPWARFLKKKSDDIAQIEKDMITR